MSQITVYYLNSELAFAAYADLVPGSDPIPALTADPIGMSSAQAEAFAENWRVVEQYTPTVLVPDPSGIGYIEQSLGLSATIFERVDASGNPTGERYLAVRGTEPSDPADLWADLELAVLGSPEYVEQYSLLSAQVGQWLEDGVLTPGFTVSGHSLGGFLAGALLVDYPTQISHAYLYNAPGVAGALLPGVMSLLGLATEPTLDLSRVSNLIAEAGLSLTAGLGLDWGAPVPVLIEDQSPNLIANHSIVHLTDALAVHALLGELSATSDIAELGDILGAATNQNDWTLEAVVNAVGDLLQAGVSITGTEDDVRNALYTRIQAIQGSAAYQSAVQSADFAQVVSLASLSSDQIAELATTDIAYRYALVNLTPFALVTADAALYVPHNANGELDLYDPATGAGTLTGSYLDDRADMLHWLLKNTTEDNAGGVAFYYGSDERYFYDATTNTQLWVGNPLDVQASTGSIAQYHFGNSSTDTLTGGSAGDHLYGMAGNDLLNGADGRDYLEGGSGNDSLNGGTGTDTLLGGADNDTLTSGAGDDQLFGGTGSDTYLYTSGDGHDVIDDADGLGAIEYDGMSLTGGRIKTGATNLYVSADDTFTYIVSGDLTTGATLVINDTLTVLNFRNGQLGITLNDTPDTPPAYANILGTAGNDDSSLPDGTSTLVTTATNQAVYGLDGDDRIELSHVATQGYGSLGMDILVSSEDDQQLCGEDGKDILRAGIGAQDLFGGAGVDAVHVRIGKQNESDLWSGAIWRMAA